MLTFETILVLLVAATLLSAAARRLNIPYPTVLAFGGAAAAFLPGGPRLDMPPDLILALFVAPVLLDAAFDASLRDLRNNWRPVLSLVLVAVGLTTAVTAWVARWLFPDMPWAAAVALGALVAPPDAVAALAVMAQVKPPHQIRKIIEGESLLNDASALLIYRLAVGAVAAGGFDPIRAVPTFILVVFGSAIAGWLLARPVGWLVSHIDDAPSSVIFQFAITFGIWLGAEHLGLSSVVTVVVFALTAARRADNMLSAQLRIPSYAIWDSVTVVLNALAFTLIGLQIRPILAPLSGPERTRYLVAALAIFIAVVAIRLAWVLVYSFAARWRARRAGPHALAPPTMKGGLVIGWAGMRGIVTLAAAIALPPAFPYRDFIQFAAFIVVFGTLVVQGITLRPLLLWLKFPKDETVQTELRLARKMALKAVLAELANDASPEAAQLRLEYEAALEQAKSGLDPRDRPANRLRRQAVAAAREAIDKLRHVGTIGDDAYHEIEEELDWLEISVRPRGAVSSPAQ
jgi:monovalent cation/hydrogen antiporter